MLRTGHPIGPGYGAPVPANHRIVGTLLSPEHEVARFLVLSAMSFALLVAMFTGAFESDYLPGASAPVESSAGGAPAAVPGATSVPAAPSSATAPGATTGSDQTTADKVSMILAHTASGRQRNRARVVVSVSVRNGGTHPMFTDPNAGAELRIGGARAVPADVYALALPGSLDMTRPLAAGRVRRGELRFEIAGAQTKTVQTAGAELRLDPQANEPVQTRIEVPAVPTAP